VAEGTCLLTLVGPAGVGKTRPALAAGTDADVTRRFPDGVTLVDLVPIQCETDGLFDNPHRIPAEGISLIQDSITSWR
jgi:hypothetical protein